MNNAGILTSMAVNRLYDAIRVVDFKEAVPPLVKLDTMKYDIITMLRIPLAHLRDDYTMTTEMNDNDIVISIF